MATPSTVIDAAHVKECRYCGAPIVWAQAATGMFPVPIDAAPFPKGSISLLPTGWRKQPYESFKHFPDRPRPAGPLYEAHDCPQAPWKQPASVASREATRLSIEER